MLTLISKNLFGIRCMPLCLFLFISTSAFSQNLQLQRTWALGREGVLDRPKTMTVQNSGDHFAVVHQYERTFDVILYDRTTAMKWRRSFSRKDETSAPIRQPIAVAFSPLADGVFVLIREEFTGYGNGRLIKYDMSGEVVWSTGIFGRDNYPEVLLAASNGDAIVAGWDMNPVEFGVSPMYVTRYHASGGAELWTSTFDVGLAITAPTAIAQSLDNDLIYLTGTGSHFQNFSNNFARSLTLHYPSQIFTMAINVANGGEVWRDVLGEYGPGPEYRFKSGHGYAIQPLNDGVAVLGQLVTSEVDASTVLIKYDLGGEEAWRITRESDFLNYPELIRNNLACDIARGILYIAYPLKETPKRAAVEKIKDDGAVGTPIWSRTTWPDIDTEVRSLNCSSVSAGKLYLGVHVGPPFDQNKVQVLSSSDNSLVANGVLRDGIEINQIEPIPHPDVVILPNDTAVVFVSGSIDRRFGFIERYQLKALPSFPGPLESVGHFSSDILDEVSWRVEAFCHDVDPCVDLSIKAHALQNAKEIWSKEFSKPTEITLSPTGIPTTYGLQLEVNKEYKEVITMDETLFAAGVKGVNIQTDTKDQSLTINSTTDGKQVPFTLSLLNSQGITIKQYNLVAPGQLVITDKQDEQVARLLLSATDPIQINVYPNPSAGEFAVVTNNQKKSKTTVSVFTLSGHNIYHESIESGEKLAVKIASAKPGLYVLLVKSGAYDRRQLIEIKY